MNKVQLIGRLTKDIDLKTSQSGKKYCFFTVACDRKFKNQDGKRESDFITCVAWNQTAEFLSKYFGKGSRIAVVGSIQTRSVEQNGQKQYFTEVLVEDVEFVESNKAPQQTQTEQVNTSAPSENLPFEL